MTYKALNHAEPVDIHERDRVKSKTGRLGWVRKIRNGDTAVVIWDDGQEFPIKVCHLEVLLHDVDQPVKSLNE